MIVRALFGILGRYIEVGAELGIARFVPSDCHSQRLTDIRRVCLAILRWRFAKRVRYPKCAALTDRVLKFHPMTPESYQNLGTGGTLDQN